MRNLILSAAALGLAVGCSKAEPIRITPASPAEKPAAGVQPMASDANLATTVVSVSGMS